jgi:hypothetical protein
MQQLVRCELVNLINGFDFSMFVQLDYEIHMEIDDAVAHYSTPTITVFESK